MTPEKYITDVMPEVKGWLTEADARAMVAVNMAQRALGIKGPLVEVGVYRGRTLGLMCTMAGPTETVIGIDEFKLGQSSLEAARELVVRCSPVGDIEIVRCKSAEVPGDVWSKCCYARMVHIDGSPQHEDVLRDLHLYTPRREEWVMVIDDFWMPEHIGVSIAACEWMRRTKATPFMTSPGKLFACHEDIATPLHNQLLTSELITPMLGALRAQKVVRTGVLVTNATIPQPFETVRDQLIGRS